MFIGCIMLFTVRSYSRISDLQQLYPNVVHCMVQFVCGPLYLYVMNPSIWWSAMVFNTTPKFVTGSQWPIEFTFLSKVTLTITSSK